MTHPTNKTRLQANLVLIAICILAACDTRAEAPDGKWKFEKAVDYTAPRKPAAVPKFPLVDLLGRKILLLSRCFVYLKETRKTGILRPFINAGETQEDVELFLKNNFAVNPNQIQKYFMLEQSSCTEKFGDFAFVSADKLFVVHGATFRQYSRVIRSVSNGPDANLLGRIPTPLPFTVSSYLNLCAPRIPNPKGEVQTTNKCAPLYYPYIVSKKDSDSLAKLIGSHNYQREMIGKTDADYNNPVGNGYHPTFVVLPPFEGVMVVRVDDFEQGEKYDRDGIPGAYLTIKDGKVVDQLDQGCDIDEQYYCTDSDGKRLYKILKTGKFKALN